MVKPIVKKLWLSIVKPSPRVAKVLVLLIAFSVLYAGFSGQLDYLKTYLDKDEFTFKNGDFELSLYQILRDSLLVIATFWITAILSDFIESRLSKVKKVRAATRTLITKIIQIALYIIAFLVVLNAMGIDLTVLTVFSGAIGIGLGFGLQKTASNFISGLILLFEKTVEQDDLIELTDGTMGFVKKTSARYTLLETFDSREILVPNEDLMTGRVVNWTLTNSKGRIEITVGVSYGSDIQKAHSLILEAAKEHPKSIKDPEPQCYLRNFGDSSVDFILHFWVKDVTEGRWLPQSEVMFAIWNKFKDNNIEIPFPQRDLHIKDSSAFVLKKSDGQ